MSRNTLDGLTNEELVARRRAIESDPNNRSPEGSLYIYVPAARRKLDKIDWQITHNLRQARIARGEPVDSSGYSGRQSKRRR